MRHHLDHRSRLLHLLLHSVGLACVAPACGGKVVVDGTPSADSGSGAGSSSSGGTGGGAMSSAASTSGSSSSTGGDPDECDVRVDELSELIHHCPPEIVGPPCAAASSAEVLAALKKALDVDLMPQEFCCEPGCAGEAVTTVPCGPDSTRGGCCYFAVVTLQDYCMGRPFTVGGVARTAAAIRRDGWSAAGAPDMSRLDTGARAALARKWRNDALLEHASIASFARFVLDLMALGAPADLVEGAVRAMGEEVRHAELCFGLASAYAGSPVGPSALSIEAADEARDVERVLADVVEEGCIGETLAALSALEAGDVADDPYVASVLSTIAEDEASHAALAWRVVAWALSHDDPRLRDAARRALESALAPGRAERPGVADVVRPCARALLAAAA